MAITIPDIDRSAYTGSKSIQRAADSLATFVQYMRIDHGRTHILVPQQLLNCPDIIAALQQMCGKRMTESVARRKRIL